MGDGRQAGVQRSGIDRCVMRVLKGLAMETTLNNELPAAEICRRNGWTAGTLLAGDEGDGITVIEITAVGKLNILAQTVSHDGELWDDTEDECEWTLWCRDWKAVHNAK